MTEEALYYCLLSLNFAFDCILIFAFIAGVTGVKIAGYRRTNAAGNLLLQSRAYAVSLIDTGAMYRFCSTV